jgi:hypothetical protein
MKFAKTAMLSQAVLSLTSALSVSRKCTTQGTWSAGDSTAFDFSDNNTKASWSLKKMNNNFPDQYQAVTAPITGSWCINIDVYVPETGGSS